MKWSGVAVTVLFLAMGQVGIRSASAQPPPPPTYAPIPPPRVEVVPPPPGAGHWHWDGYRYVWRPGQYVARGPHYGHYVERPLGLGSAPGPLDLALRTLGVAARCGSASHGK